MGTELPLVSVLMNCYNGSKYLVEAIDSVFAQTYANWEIIFWDNQSTDKSADIFKAYSDPRCKYFYAPRHTHVYEARNYAIAQAKGKYFAFLDCDDLWDSDKLEKQYKILETTPNPDEIGIIYGRMRVINMKGSPIPNKWDDGTLPEGRIFDQLLEEDFIPLLSAVVRKKAFTEIGEIPRFYKTCGDYYLFLAIAKKWKVIALQSPCCSYRWHDSNLSHVYRERTLWENQLIRLKWDPSYSLPNFISESLSLLNRKIRRSLFPLERGIRRNRKGRSVFIWGAGEKGKKCLSYLTGMNVDVAGFVDKDSTKQKSGLLDKPVFSPDEISREKHMVVISSMYGTEIEDELKVRGLTAGADFIHDNLI